MTSFATVIVTSFWKKSGVITEVDSFITDDSQTTSPKVASQGCCFIVLCDGHLGTGVMLYDTQKQSPSIVFAFQWGLTWFQPVSGSQDKWWRKQAFETWPNFHWRKGATWVNTVCFQARQLHRHVLTTSTCGVEVDALKTTVTPFHLLSTSLSLSFSSTNFK